MVFLFQVHERAQGNVYSVLNQKRGSVFATDELPTGQVILKAHLPVQESFGKLRVKSRLNLTMLMT